MVNDVITNFTLFLDNGSEVGQIRSFTPPTLAVMEEDIRAAGLDSVISVDMGMEKLECEFETAGIPRSVFERFGITTQTRQTLTVRASVQDTKTGLRKPVYHTVSGFIRSIEQSSYTPGEIANLTVRMSLRTYKLVHTLAGIPVIHVDVDNYIRIINGVDQLAADRLILGR